MTAPTITRCGHRFDQHCLARWMSLPRADGVQVGGGCPLCKCALGRSPPEVNEKLRLTIFATFPDAMNRAQRHQELATLHGHRARLCCVLLAPVRQLVAAETPPVVTLFTGGEDGDVRVWSLPDWK